MGLIVRAENLVSSARHDGDKVIPATLGDIWIAVPLRTHLSTPHLTENFLRSLVNKENRALLLKVFVCMYPLFDKTFRA